MSRIETIQPPPNSTVLDVSDPEDYDTNLANSAGWMRGGAISTAVAGYPVGPILNSLSGFAVTVAPVKGSMWSRATSAAATVKSATVNNRYTMPVGMDLAATPQGLQGGYRPQLFRFDLVVNRQTTPLVANAPLGIGIQWNGGSSRILSDMANAGYELVSDSTVNGGRWTVRTRLAAGGGLVVVQDTGISPDDGTGTLQQAIQLRYEHTTNPRLSFLINGVEFGVLQGIANVPTRNGNAVTMGVVLGLSAGGGAGQIDNYSRCRYRINTLTGFPDT